MKAFTVSSNFCTIIFFNFWVKLNDLYCELFVGPQIYVLNLIWYQSLSRTRHFSYYRFILGSKKNWAKLLLLVLHQKWRIYHLISQVKELLIKLAWSTMLGVMKIQKVQAVDLILFVWLCDLKVIILLHYIHYSSSVSFTAFATAA